MQFDNAVDSPKRLLYSKEKKKSKILSQLPHDSLKIMSKNKCVHHFIRLYLQFLEAYRWHLAQNKFSNLFHKVSYHMEY